MAYRWPGKFFEVDPDNPSAESICDRCGFRFNAKRMVWQFDFRGTVRPINTRVLVCGRPSCLDIPQPQLAPNIVSPDPMPIYNARVEPYAIDENSWIATEPTYDGPLPQTSTSNTIVEETGDQIVLENNPEDPADVADLTTDIPNSQNNP